MLFYPILLPVIRSEPWKCTLHSLLKYTFRVNIFRGKKKLPIFKYYNYYCFWYLSIDDPSILSRMSRMYRFFFFFKGPRGCFSGEMVRLMPRSSSLFIFRTRHNSRKGCRIIERPLPRPIPLRHNKCGNVARRFSGFLDEVNVPGWDREQSWTSFNYCVRAHTHTYGISVVRTNFFFFNSISNRSKYCTSCTCWGGEVRGGGERRRISRR